MIIVVNNRLNILSSIVLVCILLSCNNSLNNPSDYFKYLEAKENGICKTKRHNAVEIKTKLIPAEYLCFKDSNGNLNQAIEDSLMEFYKYNISFLVTIGPNKNSDVEFDLTSVGISNMEEYKERSELLNFQLKSFFKLVVNNIEYEPVFCEMENVYGLTLDRKFNLVFSPVKDKDEFLVAKNYTLVYNDELLKTGISKFKFKRQDLEDIPKINFWN